MLNMFILKRRRYMLKLYSFCFCILTLLFGCAFIEDNQKVSSQETLYKDEHKSLEHEPDSFDISSIFGIKFFLSYEEHVDLINKKMTKGYVYRPEGYEFPPSFPRKGFKFEANGQFTFYEASPTDGIIQIEGRWEQHNGLNMFDIYQNNELVEVIQLRGGPDKIERWDILYLRSKYAKLAF